MAIEEKVVLSRLNINIDKTLKDDFLQLCKNNDSDGTKVIKQFIKSYIKKNEKLRKEHAKTRTDKS